MRTRRPESKANRRAPLRAGLILVAMATSALYGAAQSPAGNILSTPTLSYVNSRTPDWITLSGEFRIRFESRQGLGYVDGNNDAYGLARTRLNLGIRPAPWIELFIQAQDSRAPGIRPGATNNGVFRDEADLRQAYVRIGGAETSPVSVTVGRQLLLFGDQRLVGPLDWTNTARTWDAVRLEIRPATGVKFDVFASSVVANTPGLQMNRTVDGTNLHGVYGSIGSVIPKSTIEPFVFWRTASRVVGEDGVAGDMDKYSAGARIAGSGIVGFDYAVTLVDQWGDFATSTVDAWAYSLGMGYSIAADVAPRVYAEYNYGSGDSDSSDGQIGWFDDVYPTAHLYYGYNDLVGWRNIRNLRLGATVEPFDRLGIRVDYHSFWLADTSDNLYNVAGAVTVRPPAGGAADAKVGDEVDVTISVPITSTL